MLILADDGSTDDSGKLCDQYAAVDSRIRTIHKPNTGVSDTRNQALNIARGPYIQFVDSDDWISPESTSLMIRSMEMYNCDLVISDFYRVSGEHLARKGDINETRILSREEFASFMMENPADFYYGVLWNKLYKRELLAGIQFPKGKKMEDLAVMYKIFEKAEKIVNTNKTEYYYLQRSSSILGNIDMQLTNDLYGFVTERYQYIIRKYPELKENLDIDRIRYILIYHKNIALLSNKKAYKENKLITEYLFFKEVFKKYKNVICSNIGIMSKLEYKLLYFSRRLFFRYYQVKKILKKVIKKK